MKRRLTLALFYCANALGASAVLNSGTHAATMIGPAVTAVGGTVDTTVFVDRTSDPPGNIVAQSSVTTGTPYFRVSDSAAVNHAVYPVINLSYSGYSILEDQQNYSTLQPQGTVFSRPFARALQVAGTPPPVVEVVSSSSNSGNGGTGAGIEFALSASYKGLDTTADSWVSAEMAGLLAMLSNNHPTWTWGDVKGALRQTAANWSTGYNAASFGYGAINWDSATAIGSTSSLFLQPPVLVAGVLNGQVHITLYPFRTTRRHHEVVYLLTNVSYSWPVKNEYALSDITASGATLVYTGNSTDLIPSATLATLSSPGTYTLVAFTTDNAGAYSRVESFSLVTTPAIACL